MFEIYISKVFLNLKIHLRIYIKSGTHKLFLPIVMYQLIIFNIHDLNPNVKGEWREGGEGEEKLGKFYYNFNEGKIGLLRFMQCRKKKGRCKTK